MIIQSLLTITNLGRGFLLHMIFGAGQDPRVLICLNVEALDAEENLLLSFLWEIPIMKMVWE